MKAVRVIFIPPGAAPRFFYYDANDYTQSQALVGGIISSSALSDNLYVTFNDEGLLIGLPPNVKTPTGVLLVGNLIVSRVDDKETRMIDVTGDDMETVKRWLDASRTFTACYDVPEPQMFFGTDAGDIAKQAAAAPPMPPTRYIGTIKAQGD